MLSSLHIENIAVIKNIDIDFHLGFCAISGETGAGKTVITEAVKLLLGTKPERELVRRGEQSAEVSAVFTDISPDVAALASELGYDCADLELLVLRSFSADGRSSFKINGKNATVSIGKSIVGRLLDMHGQHDSISLLDRKTHLSMLDRYADTAELLFEYKEKYSCYTELKRKIKELEDSRLEGERQLDFLNMQIKELDGAKLQRGETEKLESEKKRLSTIEKVSRQTSFAYRAIYGGERGNACMLLDKSISSLLSVETEIPEIAKLTERLRNEYYELCDIAEGLEKYTGEQNSEKLLDKIEARLDVYAKLKRKYNTDTEGLLLYLEKIKAKASTFENLDTVIAELSSDFKNSEAELRESAKRLTEKRKKAAEELGREVAGVLEFLDMPKVRFTAELTEGQFTPLGADEAAFMLSLSENEPMIELSEASGGELSRVMLALKSVLCEKYGAQTVIYDEIDTGVSGKTARKIGIKLKESAKSSQIICITHSAQIASLCDAHYKISKEATDGRFESKVALLDREGRIEELSRILGGISVTDAQRQAAMDMLSCQDLM